MTQELKSELVMFVLEKCPVWYFNQTTKGFSVQKLYGRYKMELMAAYPELMAGNLYYAIAMSEAFEDYKCCEVQCPALRHQIDILKGLLSFYKKCRPAEYARKVKEYNALVDQYNELLAPQNKLIALYKKVQREKTKRLAA